jgi:hypothetical protein
MIGLTAGWLCLSARMLEGMRSNGLKNIKKKKKKKMKNNRK